MKLRVKGQRGQRVEVRFAEFLDEKGRASQDNLRTVKGRYEYVLKGGGWEEYEPRFTYYGFRYAEVRGLEGEPEAGTIVGRYVRSAVAQTGSFKCSDELVNKIHEIIVRTEANNLHSVPTDCPQRDERLGWLNDMTTRAEEGLYNFDLARLYGKWLVGHPRRPGPRDGSSS